MSSLKGVKKCAQKVLEKYFDSGHSKKKGPEVQARFVDLKKMRDS